MTDSGSYENERHEHDKPVTEKKCAECMHSFPIDEKFFPADKWMFDGAELCSKCLEFYQENDEPTPVRSSSDLLRDVFAGFAEVFDKPTTTP